MKDEEEKIAEFLFDYFDYEQSIKFIEYYGKSKYVSIGIFKLIDELHILEDKLRKDLSIYLERIVSVDEFRSLKEIDYYKVC